MANSALVTAEYSQSTFIMRALRCEIVYFIKKRALERRRKLSEGNKKQQISKQEQFLGSEVE